MHFVAAAFVLVCLNISSHSYIWFYTLNLKVNRIDAVNIPNLMVKTMIVEL
jgi:hypothetical protein